MGAVELTVLFYLKAIKDVQLGRLSDGLYGALLDFGIYGSALVLMCSGMRSLSLRTYKSFLGRPNR